ncbi:MAG: cyclic nucleotide-binding domain-containing protein [Nitrospiraceae bacterium]|nr:cyclic nucleotide-binding domain-containing protein [Nitrospiraceae bacterium]
MADTSELKKQLLFSDLTETELGMIAKKITVEKFAKGKPIFKAGEQTKGIFLVKTGKVEISMLTADGWKQTLALLSENHIFGELSVIENKPTHGADATAIDDTEVYRFKTEDFKAFEQSDTNMMYKIMKTIARIASKNVHSMNEKLMKLLISY